jgi:ubiquitin carboxyl-terminal hydrolase L3
MSIIFLYESVGEVEGQGVVQDQVEGLMRKENPFFIP